MADFVEKKGMTLERSIEILADYKMQSAFEAMPNFKNALKVGIEAMKRVGDMRISPCTTADELLPGETKD